MTADTNSDTKRRFYSYIGTLSGFMDGGVNVAGHPFKVSVLQFDPDNGEQRPSVACCLFGRCLERLKAIAGTDEMARVKMTGYYAGRITLPTADFGPIQVTTFVPINVHHADTAP